MIKTSVPSIRTIRWILYLATLFGVSDLHFHNFKPIDRFRYILHHVNAKSMLRNMLQKYRNRRKYPCDSFRGVGSHIHLLDRWQLQLAQSKGTCLSVSIGIDRFQARNAGSFRWVAVTDLGEFSPAITISGRNLLRMRSVFTHNNHNNNEEL